MIKRYRNSLRGFQSGLLCIVLILCIFCISATADTLVATPTDLTEKEEDYEAIFILDGVRIIVNAEAGVFSGSGELTVEKADCTALAKEVEAALEIGSDSNAAVFHAAYSFSAPQMDGTARVRMEKLGLTEVKAQYPDGKIEIYVTRYDKTAKRLQDRTKRIKAEADIDRDTVVFSLSETGLYDVVTAVYMPAQAETAEEATPDKTTDSGTEQDVCPEEEQKDGEQPAAVPEPGNPDEEVLTDEQDEAATEKNETIAVKDDGGTAAAEEDPEQGDPEIPIHGFALTGPDADMDAILRMTANEPDKVKAFVIRCYWLILGREPDQKGLENWTSKLKSRSASAAAIISGFVNSKEFRQMHKSSEALIEILYRTMLNRASDESGRRHWGEVIASGASMNHLVNGFSNSNEFRGICASYGIEGGTVGEGGSGEPVAYSERLTAFVTRCYREALGREPDIDGRQFWCLKLTTKAKTFEEVASAFVFSKEMNSKKLSDEAFTKVLYRLYLGREAEEAGLKHWTGKLKEGMTREQVNEKFANSQEFAGIVSSFDTEAGAEPEFNYIIVPDDKGLIVNNGAKVQVQVSPELAAKGIQLKWASSDTKIFTVSETGELFGAYPGHAALRVSLPDGKVIAQVAVNVKANYRAVLFSESTFTDGVIRRNRGDVRLMQEMLSAVTGPDGGMYKYYSFDDLEADEVYAKINQLLVAPSRDGDVSMFFFASHGDYKSTSREHAGRLWCKNKATWLQLPDLARVLTGVRGKVIVLLESCGPGAAVREYSSNSGTLPEEEDMDDPELAAAILSAFSAADPGLSVYQTEEVQFDSPDWRNDAAGTEKSTGAETSGNLFLTEKFIVMTAAAYRQVSYSAGQDACNLFPKWLVNGVGTSGNMPADILYGNSDGKLTVDELYQYVYKKTIHKQTPQVYPKNSDYVLFLRK